MGAAAAAGRTRLPSTTTTWHATAGATATTWKGSRKLVGGDADAQCSSRSREVGVSESSMFSNAKRALAETIILRHCHGAPRSLHPCWGCPTRRLPACASGPPMRMGPPEPFCFCLISIWNTTTTESGILGHEFFNFIGGSG